MPQLKWTMANTLTPFLYQTRTLSRVAAKAGSSALRSGLHTTPLRRRQDYNDIPFELPPDVDRNPSVHRSGASDTLTPDEREIFGGIFNEIARHGKKPKIAVKPDDTIPAQREPAKGAPQFLAGLIAGSTTSGSRENKATDSITAVVTANAIMEDAANQAGLTRQPGIRGLDPLSPLEATYSADEREKTLLQFPPTLRKAARHAFGMFNVFEPTQTEGDGQEALGTAPDHPDPIEAVDAGRSKDKLVRTIEIEAQRRHERLRILARLQACINDFEVWEVMEKEVFPLVGRLGITDVPANADFRPQKAKKRGRKKKGEVVDVDVADVGEAKAKTATASAKGELDMEIYGPIYPQLLLDGLNLLGNKFARPSPYTTHVLTRVKQLGLVSYVLGISTAFYNRLILVLWNRYGDAQGVLDLLEEMRHAGLYFDEDSFSVVSRIQTMYEQADRGERGRFVQEVMRMPEYEPMVAQRISHWAGTIDASIRERRLGMNF